MRALRILGLLAATAVAGCGPQPAKTADVAKPALTPAPRQVAVLSQASSAAGGRTLADGVYACSAWLGSSLMSLGEVEVRGGQYRGPSHDQSGTFRPLDIDGAGRMTWSPNFSQLAAAGATLGRSQLNDDGGFTVEYLTARGYRESLECARK